MSMMSPRTIARWEAAGRPIVPVVVDPDDYEPERRPGCRCRHNTADPERGCECGWADWLCDNGGNDA